MLMYIYTGSVINFVLVLVNIITLFFVLARTAAKSVMRQKQDQLAVQDQLDLQDQLDPETFQSNRGGHVSGVLNTGVVRGPEYRGGHTFQRS